MILKAAKRCLIGQTIVKLTRMPNLLPRIPCNCMTDVTMR